MTCFLFDITSIRFHIFRPWCPLLRFKFSYNEQIYICHLSCDPMFSSINITRAAFLIHQTPCPPYPATYSAPKSFTPPSLVYSSGHVYALLSITSPAHETWRIYSLHKCSWFQSSRDTTWMPRCLNWHRKSPQEPIYASSQTLITTEHLLGWLWLPRW